MGTGTRATPRPAPRWFGRRRLGSRWLNSQRRQRGGAWFIYLLIALSVTWPFLLGPYGAGVGFLHRDMAVIDQPRMTLTALGLSSAARAAPQDGALALLAAAGGGFIPATAWVRAGMVGAAVAGAWAGRRLGGYPGALMVVFNPLVVERLLQGHWSFVIAVWLLPAVWVLATGPRGRGRWALVAAIWACTTSPTGAVLVVVLLLVACVATRRAPHTGPRARPAAVALALMLCLPWLLPSLLAPQLSDTSAAAATAGVRAFAPRAEALAGTLGTVLSLGGLWNAQAAPASRELGLTLVGTALGVLCVVRLLRGRAWALAVLVGLGVGGALVGAALATAAPQALGAAMAQVPALQLFRDSHKLTALAVPGYAWAVGALARDLQAATRLGPRAAGALLCAVVVAALPDGAAAVAPLRPVRYHFPAQLVATGAPAWQPVAVPGGVLVRVRGVPTVRPEDKAWTLELSRELVVDGQGVDAPAAPPRPFPAGSPPRAYALLVAVHVGWLAVGAAAGAAGVLSLMRGVYARRGRRSRVVS